MRELVDKLAQNRVLSAEEFKELLSAECENSYLHQRAREAQQRVYGKKIFIRGLVEFTNYCKHNCYYCGLRSGNTGVQRYRLSMEQIMECCQTGYGMGFRTFVLQGGEDDYYTDDRLTEIIGNIRETYPDCAITLSVGERSRESFQRLFDAGADRYLLRHETANIHHYNSLHPANMSPENRKKCLRDLKEIGFQVGCGFLIGSPGQTPDNIVEDFLFIKELDPAMVGIGPFIPHSATPFANEQAGGLNLTLNALAILRLMKPNLLLPATTALGSIHEKGREMGILAGANVVMPNLSPVDTRKKYLLYDSKIGTEDEPQNAREKIDKQMQVIGYEVITARGDYVAI
ncbi:MAG: [FeFe] hydrogenase H-cluster radical SAM maturase HydE [Firmicutes bacterium]|nr:[FeFe] hydrogenase H-cluster radical SAM maturase HydE [Bacillota bacterium]